MTLTLQLQMTGQHSVGALASEALEVIGTPAKRDRLHECSGDHCELVFVDTSRSGSRSWRSMERCGNRRKVRTPWGRLAGTAAAPASPVFFMDR
ncbi:CGNR zinc finger domain-containing protein [Actinoplanes sp. NPDC051633]|uniref:CGNR zinc finger domain-containing protein n=1 Tax=Actinoplanes sp. NPDC051633 TaxID=3155670 RepID=UPI003442EC8A